MKVKVIETGEIFEVERHEYNCELKKMIFFDKNRREYKEDEIELLECGKYYDIPVKHVDWEQRRYELAKAALNGMLAHSRNGHGYHPRDPQMNWHDAIAEESIEIADAVIEKLKKL